MTLNVSVHHFSVGSSSSTSQTILESALDLLDNAVINSKGWCTVEPLRGEIKVVNGMCLQWRKAAPVIKGNGKAKCQEELLDWDAPFDDDEIYTDVSALPEFESTDISEVIEKTRRVTKRKQPLDSPSSQGLRNFADDIDMNREERALKRPRNINSPTELNTSISELIPFPHYHASPDPTCPPPAGIRLIPSFKVLRIFCQSISLKKPFARAAWVVPLRGGPAVEGTSKAHLCSHVLLDEMSPKDPVPRHIQWTPAAVTQFWNFLLFQRTMNNFGPLSLAYIMCPYQSSNKSQICESKTTDVKGKLGKSSSKMKSNDGNNPAVIWEYIKIYHDAQFSLKLRSLLNSFRWEDSSISQRTSSIKTDPIRYRVLKGASLVLLDEIGEPLLLS